MHLIPEKHKSKTNTCLMSYNWTEGLFNYRAWGSLGKRIPLPSMWFPLRLFFVIKPSESHDEMSENDTVLIPSLFAVRKTGRFFPLQIHFTLPESISAAMTFHSCYLHSDWWGAHPGRLSPGFLKDSFTPSSPLQSLLGHSHVCPRLYQSGSGNGQWTSSLSDLNSKTSHL